MGRGETGGTASLPTWINYMRTALADVPERALPRPPGIKSAPVPDDSGRSDFHYAENEPPAPLPDEELLDPFLLPGNGGSEDIPATQTPAPVEERILPPLAP
jgi:penicillin-binding protein 1A